MVSVDDLAKRAPVSRRPLISISHSRRVLLTLLDRVNQADTLQTLAENPADTDRENMWRTGINVALSSIIRVAHGNPSRSGRHNRVEVAELWSTFMQKWTAGRRDRRRTRPRRRRAPRPMNSQRST